MTMNLRSDNTSGMLTRIIGTCMALFAMQALLIATSGQVVDRWMEAHVLEGPKPYAAEAAAFRTRIYTYMPLMLVGGTVFAFSGFYVRRGSHVARRVAQGNAFLGYPWGLGYFLSLNHNYDHVNGAEQLMLVLICVGTFLTVFFLGTFPSAMLYILSRPKFLKSGDVSLNVKQNISDSKVDLNQ